jgi:peroxiredoxin
MDHLVGQSLPAVALQSTRGGIVDLSQVSGHSVVFVYPYTGRPGTPDPPDWDNIPGAHGSTPQAQAYSTAYGAFRNRNVNVFGVSLQDAQWQKEFATRCDLPFALLSDSEGRFSSALGLPFFVTGGKAYLRRLTLFVRDGRITGIRFPVPDPAGDAEASLVQLGGPEA